MCLRMVRNHDSAIRVRVAWQREDLLDRGTFGYVLELIVISRHPWACLAFSACFVYSCFHPSRTTPLTVFSGRVALGCVAVPAPSMAGITLVELRLGASPSLLHRWQASHQGILSWQTDEYAGTFLCVYFCVLGHQSPHLGMWV
jgi:hypothetical protein